MFQLCHWLRAPPNLSLSIQSIKQLMDIRMLSNITTTILQIENLTFLPEVRINEHAGNTIRFGYL